MIYGKDKAKNMSRSILPSTRSSGAGFDKAKAKRATRHSVKTELQRTTIDPDYYDETDTDFEEDANVSRIVNDRRGGDKTAPLQRWAKAITKKVDRDSRLSHVKSLLPENVIGEHALGHVKGDDHFSSRAKIILDKNKELNRQDKYAAINVAEKRLTHDEQVATLRKIVEDGRLHRELNKFADRMAWQYYKPRPTIAEMKSVFNEQTQKVEKKYVYVELPYPPGKVNTANGRKLLGLHDIETFLSDIKKSQYNSDRLYIDGKWYANPEHQPGIYQSVQTFLDAVFNKQPLPRKPNNKYR